MNKIKFRPDVFRGKPKYPQCVFFEEFPSSLDPYCDFYGTLFCRMSGEESDAEKCKGDYLECPLAYGGKKNTVDVEKFLARESRRADRHKADIKAVAKLEADLCKGD